MAKRKPTKKYYFSVEGETERWYLEWLSDQINGTEESAYNVSFKIKIEKDPRKMVKSLTISGKTDIWHLSDYESNDPDHVRQFTETMDNMKKAQGMGKTVKYYFGYSNFSFDLWIVLHRMNCNQALAHRSQYLSYINRAYEENFENMDKYKRENNFKRCLDKLDLESVRDAIGRAEAIMDNREKDGCTLREYRGFTYYKENPSLEVWKAIKIILTDCKLM